MNLDFEPGVVLVAGGSGGIGEAISRRFAQAGLPVVLTYNSRAEKAAAVRESIRADGGHCECEQLDLSDAARVEALFARVRHDHGRIGQVVYAAGPSFDFNPIGDIPDEQWHHVINSDVNGAFHLIQAAVRAFKAQNGGNLAAVITAAVERVPYGDIMSAAPKAAIEMLMRGVALESGKYGIRANCVGPGWIDAGLGRQALEEKLGPDIRERIIKKGIPLRRLGSADDIAWAVLFLCSKQASFITGQSLAVDGGAQV